MQQSPTTLESSGIIVEREVAKHNHHHNHHHHHHHHNHQQEKERIQESFLKKEFDGEEKGGGQKLTTDCQKTAPKTIKMTEMAAAGNCCSGCREPIRDKFMFEVFGMHWHKDCIQCADCSLKLNDRCNSVDGKLYCKLDYWRRFGPKCFACRESIEQSDIVQKIRGNRIYHLKCFTCNICQRQLKTGEHLHLIDEKKLLCRQDYHHYMKSLGAGAHKNSNGFSPGSGGIGAATTTPNDSHQQQQQQQATYYTLISSHQADNDAVAAAAADSKSSQQHQTGIKLEASPKLPLDHQRSSLSTNETANSNSANDPNADLLLSGGEEDDDEDLEEDDEDEPELDGCELMDGEHDGGNLAPGAGAPGCDSLDGMRRLLGYDNDNNLENEENRSSSTMFGHAGPLSTRDQQRQQSAKQSLKKGASGGAAKQVNGSGPTTNSNSKRKRRRKQRLGSTGAAAMSTEGSVAAAGRSIRASTLIPGQQPATGNKKLASRNGESILNGVPSAASILASHAAIPTGGQLGDQGRHQQALGAQQLHPQYQHLQQQQQNAPNNKSVSSSASTASNSSRTSSSSSLGHHNAQQQQHNNNGNNNKQQQQQQQYHQHHNQQQHQHGSSAGQQQQQQLGNSGGGHKPTRVRTVLNEKQLSTLRTCYSQNPRPDALMKEQLVDMTGLSPRVIRVWFQNKRCKDKKKHMLYKQMQQSEKEGRHLAGLGMMRGVPMVASSPIQYDDHSTVSSTPGLQQQAGTTMLELQPGGGAGPREGAPGSPQQRGQTLYAPQGSVHSPASAAQAADITVYQPNWDELIDYAQQQHPPGSTPPDRLGAASPRYQQLMGQIRGYNNPPDQTAVDQGAQVVELQQRQPAPQFPAQQAGGNPAGYPTGLADQRNAHHPHHAHLSLSQQQAQVAPPQAMSHLHQFQR